MGRGLHKLGDIAFAHPWRVLAVWAVVIALLAFSAVEFFKAPSSNISIPNTEAQQAIDRMGELFPNAGQGSGRIVFKAHDGKTIGDVRGAIETLVDEVSKVEGVTQAVSPFVDAQFVAKSGDIAYAQVQLEKSFGAVDDITYEGVDAAVQKARDANPELQIELGGDIVNQVPGEILGVGEIVGVGVALLVLFMTLGSLVAAGMPIATALVAVGVTIAGLFSLSQLIDINSTTPVMAIMLGLAVGIDYALFIINRYRTLVLGGLDYREAAGRAAGTAGNAVVFAALTVVIALAALSIVGIPFLTVMGLTGAASVAVAALVAITLIPAMLRLAGPYLFSRKNRQKVVKAQGAKGKVAAHSGKFWYNWGHLVTARPWLTLLIAIPLLAVIAWPVHDLKLGLSTAEFANEEKTERRAYELLEQGFGAGFNGPLAVVVEGMPAVTDADKATVRAAAMAELSQQMEVAALAQQTQFENMMAEAQTPEQMYAVQAQIAEAQVAGEAQKQAALARIDSTVEQYAKYAQLKKIADAVATLDNVQTATPALVTDQGKEGLLQIIPKSSPSSTDTVALIETLRDQAIWGEVSDVDGLTMAVTGSTAMQEDVNARLSAALPKYLGIIVGLSLILLLLAFRSVVVPLKATLGYLLSVAAMFGAMVAVFQWGWFGIADAPGPIMSFIAILGAGLLFGLAMDYEFFLVSSIHEAYEDDPKHPKKAVVEGFGVGSKVVAAAAAIMVSVFAGFITNHEVAISAIGFGLAVGVFVDAYVVRMTIVPAVLSILGKAAWWLPSWLDRWLPHISIEGEDVSEKA